jgi:hypothetical protein
MSRLSASTVASSSRCHRLPDIGQWESFADARRAMAPNFRQQHSAACCQA